jgi:hypothetical protein
MLRFLIRGTAEYFGTCDVISAAILLTNVFVSIRYRRSSSVIDPMTAIKKPAYRFSKPVKAQVLPEKATYNGSDNG